MTPSLPRYETRARKRRRLLLEEIHQSAKRDPSDVVKNTQSNPPSTEHFEQKTRLPGESSLAYWVRTETWPEDFASMSQEKRDPLKQIPSILSYAQGYRAGKVPRAHTAAYEDHLAEHGQHIDDVKGRSLAGKQSKSLCTRLLQATYPEPQHTLFPLSEFLVVCARIRNRSEARIYRDITSLLVPSPELLRVAGHLEFEPIAEEIGVEWTRCRTLGGPKPKPDLAIGIAKSAFNEQEIAKLRDYTSFERATLFTDNIYFPFLLCEVKCGEEAISRAERQNMHSSSMAVNAIIQIYQAIDKRKAADLSGQILVFSVSHNNELVKIYGHFAVIDGEKPSFYRYPIAVFAFSFGEGEDRKRTHDFIQAIYHTFFPSHLTRIRDILAQMDDPCNVSPISYMISGETESQDRKTEMALLQEQMAKQQGQTAKQQGQTAEQQGQTAEQQRQTAEQQRQTAEQQRQTAEQQRLMMEQLESYKGQLDLLKQSFPQ